MKYRNTNKKLLIILGAIMIFGAAACGSQKEQEPLTPTATPTNTPTPTPTDTPTPTYTPTPTPIPDTEPPVISGVSPIVVSRYGTISYTKGITVTDNSGEAFSFRGANANIWVDYSKVDVNTIGSYEITYTAKDSAGNEASVTTTVHVTGIDVEKLESAADELLAQIITEGMTERERAYAVFTWVFKKMGGYKSLHGEDYYENAKIGIVDKKGGDCHVFAATSQYLLERAGLESMIVNKEPVGKEPHAWNIVKVDGKWYHFDTTTWTSDTKDAEIVKNGIFLMTTERLTTSTSASIRNQHKFDASQYPKIE